MGDVIITFKDPLRPISWFAHSALMVSDMLVGEYPQPCAGYYETPLQQWKNERKIKALLRYKKLTPEFKAQLAYNLKTMKDKRYDIVSKRDASAFYCSQFVWYAYWKTAKDLGYELDIDRNGGFLVLPYDMLSSEHFHRIDTLR